MENKHVDDGLPFKFSGKKPPGGTLWLEWSYPRGKAAAQRLPWDWHCSHNHKFVEPVGFGHGKAEVARMHKDHTFLTNSGIRSARILAVIKGDELSLAVRNMSDFTQIH